MELTGYLKDPIIFAADTPPDFVSRKIHVEEHQYVFVRIDDQIYPVKSFSILLAIQSRPDHAWTISEFVTSPPLHVLPFEDLTLHVLEVLSEEVSLVHYAGKLQYFQREDFLLTQISEPNADVAWLRNLFASIPKGLMIVDLHYAVMNSNKEAQRMLRLGEKDLTRIRLNELLGSRYFQHVQQTLTPLLNQVVYTTNTRLAVLVDFVPLISNQTMTGFALVIQDLPSVESMAMELDAVKEVNQDLEAILSTIYDEIIVVDSEGKLLRASDHFIVGNWDVAPHHLIGHYIFRQNACVELLGSVFKEVQRNKKKISLLHNAAECPFLCVGNPVFTDSGKLDRVVIASRDLTEVSRLERELEETRQQSESYRQELARLQTRITQTQGSSPIYASPRMHNVIREAERVAQFSATVLLTGESGSGKEVIANTIHSLSDRRDQPFIKINCAAIPGHLLESELFGYEKGAFSGAKQEGKKGLFMKAHHGTLFLDEIPELPFETQSKLLRAIQEREVYPVGATVPVTFDVRIIAAANRSLTDLVANGKFREDLYYRINVFPIEVPPLRTRTEDVALLANHFLFQFNQLYQRNLRLSRSAIELMEAYEFPGNVRELQNIIQRMAIKNDGDLIDDGVVRSILMKDEHASPKKGLSRFTQVIPLKDAMAQVEQELVALAVKKFGTTTQAARALGISQSSVSRKYNRLKNEGNSDTRGDVYPAE